MIHAQYTPNAARRWEVAQRGAIEFHELVNRAIRSSYQAPLLPSKKRA